MVTKRLSVLKLVLGTIILILVLAGLNSISKDNSDIAVTTPNREPSQQSLNVNAQELVNINDPFLGKDNASLTIVEFLDYQCPNSRKFWRETLPKLKETYIDTGKVKFVFKDYPQSYHSGALPTAKIVECVREQGKFWEMHNKIFGEQDKQGYGTIQLDTEEVKLWSGNLGLNVKEFNECLDSGKYDDEIQNDLVAANKAGGRNTPNFVIGTAWIVGAQPFELFQEIIEAELAKSE